MQKYSNCLVDLRVLRNPNAMGLLNSMVGLYRYNENIKYAVDSEWAINFLKKYGIPEENIISINSFFSYRKLLFNNVILPIQRISLSILILRFFYLINLECFVHDLFFLSKRKLLTSEFNAVFKIPKKYLYLFTIYYVDKIYVFSELVRRQMKVCLRARSEVILNNRVFNTTSDIACNRVYDFYIPLSHRKYKGFWALSEVIFTNRKTVVAISEEHYERARVILLDKNPDIIIFSVNVACDDKLAIIYKKAKCVLCLSRYEGFGFIPFEAAYFGSFPIVLNCSAMISMPKSFFNKTSLSRPIFIQNPQNYYISNQDSIHFYSKHIQELSVGK